MLRDWNCGSTWSSRTREDGLKGGEGVALGSKAGKGLHSAQRRGEVALGSKAGRGLKSKKGRKLKARRGAKDAPYFIFENSFVFMFLRDGCVAPILRVSTES